MVTIKQIQAFYWVSKLGTLSKAADKLHITQSAATKRLKEVECLSEMPLFATDGRKNQLTSHGVELADACEKILALTNELDILRGTTHLPARILHIGLTEVTALTWFPEFVKKLKTIYPSITLRPEVDSSAPVYTKLKEGKLDFAFLPDMHPEQGLIKMPVGDVPFGWFAAPGLFASEKTHQLNALSNMTVIEQSANSIITELCNQLWEQAGVHPSRIYGGNNVHAMAGLISAGIGISCLPVGMLEPEIYRGKIELIKTNPVAPSVRYHCFFHHHIHSALGHTISDIARTVYSASVR